MVTIAAMLSAERIVLKSHAVGDHKAFCPRCHEARKNKLDRSLSVLIKDDSIVWKCWHCNWCGKRGGDENVDRPAHRDPGGARPRRGADGQVWRDRIKSVWG